MYCNVSYSVESLRFAGITSLNQVFPCASIVLSLKPGLTMRGWSMARRMWISPELHTDSYWLLEL